MRIKHFIVFILLLISVSSCNTKKSKTTDLSGKYMPSDKTLYDTIVTMDSIFFEAYNTCDMDKQAEIYDDNIEFYHDKGGLSTSKADILKATKDNICGKVTRTLIKGSIEVYPIKDYGAVELGQHKFYNNQEPNADSKPGKFIIIWKITKRGWKITRVVSLHGS